MNLDYLDLLSKPEKPMGTAETRILNKDAAVPTVPNPKFSVGTGIPNKDAAVPVVPTVPIEKIKFANETPEREYDGTCWYVRGQRVTRFPRCPQCRSYALYGPDSRGRFECLSCDLAGFTEATARNYDEMPGVVQ